MGLKCFHEKEEGFEEAFVSTLDAIVRWYRERIQADDEEEDFLPLVSAQNNALLGTIERLDKRLKVLERRMKKTRRTKRVQK